jgi:hypothetical protein
LVERLGQDEGLGQDHAFTSLNRLVAVLVSDRTPAGPAIGMNIRNSRAILFFALAIHFACAPFLAVAGTLIPEVPGHAPMLIMYLAKGAPNSCGPGCDRWIAIEGTIDADAASRVSQFLSGVKDTQLPIYFHSPGGEVRQAFAIGRLLRVRKAIGRVGRTIASACAAGSQVDDACLKIKTAGGEVQAELATRYAMCNSACSYLFLGATTREVAPDAALGVHDSKLIVEFNEHTSARQRAEFMASHRDRDDRERASFIEAMGISHELVDLIETVKFESMHILTRPELYRFGIDTRNLAETAWTLEPGARAFIRKTAFARKDDGSFRPMEWRLFCESKYRARLMFIREFDKGAPVTSSVTLIAGSEKQPSFGSFPVRQGRYEVWSAMIDTDAVNNWFALRHLQVGENTLMPDGRASQAVLEIDTNGLAGAWTRLSGACAAPPSSARRMIDVPGTPNTPAL